VPCQQHVEVAGHDPEFCAIAPQLVNHRGGMPGIDDLVSGVHWSAEKLDRGPYHTAGRNTLHASVIDGALAQKAGTAFDGLANYT
jgi:hypothetical protein